MRKTSMIPGGHLWPRDMPLENVGRAYDRRPELRPFSVFEKRLHLLSDTDFWLNLRQYAGYRVPLGWRTPMTKGILCGWDGVVPAN